MVTPIRISVFIASESNKQFVQKKYVFVTTISVFIDQRRLTVVLSSSPATSLKALTTTARRADLVLGEPLKHVPGMAAMATGETEVGASCTDTEEGNLTCGITLHTLNIIHKDY